MREVLKTYDLSLALSARIALDAASIRYSANYGDAMEPARSGFQLFVLDDADYEAAQSALSTLQVSPITVTADGAPKRFFWFCVVVGILVILIVASRNVIARG